MKASRDKLDTKIDNLSNKNYGILLSMLSMLIILMVKEFFFK